MRYHLAALLITTMALASAGCGGDEGADPNSPGSNQPAQRQSADGFTYLRPAGWEVGPEAKYKTLGLIGPGKFNPYGIDVYYDESKRSSYIDEREIALGSYSYGDDDKAEIVEEKDITLGDKKAKWVVILNKKSGTGTIAVWAPDSGQFNEEKTGIWSVTMSITPALVEEAKPILKGFVDSIEFEAK